MNQSVTEQLEDGELWRQAGQGDPAAFGVLFERHVNAVYTHCFRRTGSWEAAEDLASVVFLEAWRRRREVTLSGESILPWLLAVANNVVRNRDRSLRRHRRLLAKLPASVVAPDPADDAVARVDDERAMQRVLQVFSRLLPDEQDVLALCVWAGLSYADAAVALGVPIGTVRSRLSRARAHLRRLAGVGEPDPDDDSPRSRAAAGGAVRSVGRATRAAETGRKDVGDASSRTDQGVEDGATAGAEHVGGQRTVPPTTTPPSQQPAAREGRSSDHQAAASVAPSASLAAGAALSTGVSQPSALPTSPARSTPARSAPAQPTPAQPTPGRSTPAQPDPTLSTSAPMFAGPAPVDPAPVGPATVGPATVGPATVGPATVGPAFATGFLGGFTEGFGGVALGGGAIGLGGWLPQPGQAGRGWNADRRSR